MNKSPSQQFDNDTQDLVLLKLKDIEDVLTMRLEQGDSQSKDNDLSQQLLAKVSKSIDGLKKTIEDNNEKIEERESKRDPVQRMRFEGDRSDLAAAFFTMLRGEPADPEEVAEIMMQDEDFVKRVTPRNGDDGKTPLKGKDYFTEEDINSITEKIIEVTDLDVTAKVKNAVREAVSYKDIVDRIMGLLSQKKMAMTSIDGIEEYMSAKFEEMRENIEEYLRKHRRGGGGGIDNRVFNGNIEMQIMNGTIDISTGAKGMTSVPQDGVINEYDLFSYDDAGALLASSVSITVYKNGVAILTCALASTPDKHVNGLSIRVQKDDIIRFAVDSNTGCKNVYLSIKYSK